jgi:hypothetical protein
MAATRLGGSLVHRADDAGPRLTHTDEVHTEGNLSSMQDLKFTLFAVDGKFPGIHYNDG